MTTELIAEKKELSPEMKETFNRVMKVVADAYSSTPEKLIIKTNARATSEPRQVVIVILNVLYDFSLGECTIPFGKTHSTGITSRRTVIALYDADNVFKQRIIKILGELEISKELVDHLFHRLRNPELYKHYRNELR